MKKLFSIMLCLSFIFIMSISCFAAENYENTSCDVKGKYVCQMKNEYKTEVKDGKAEVTLPDGTIICVDGVTKDGLWFVVVPITKNDTEAYAWFVDCLKDKGTNPYTMDIYFVDEYGNRVEVTDNMTITVTIPNGYKTPTICYTDTSGNVTAIDSMVNSSTITFKTNHNSYYSIVEKKTNTLNPIINHNSNSPQTGDINSIIYLLGILLISCGTLVGTGIKKRRII